MRIFAVSALAAFAVAAPALGQQSSDAAQDAVQPAPDCFRMSQIRNHRIADRDTIYLRVGSDKVYRVTVAGSCGAGAMRDDTLVLSPTAGGDMICRPIDLDLKIRTGAGVVSPCIISAIQPLSAAEAEAIPEKLRP
jgi:hypothetical protein